MRSVGKCIQNYLNDGNKEKLNDDLHTLKYKDVTIYLVKDSNISYHEHHVTGEKTLNIGLDTIIMIIKEIKSAAKQGKLTKDYIKNINIYNQLDMWEKSSIIHELSHKSDHENLYDIFKDLFSKIYPKDKVLPKEPTQEDIEDYFQRYLKIYNDLPTEYNAYFMQVTNVIINKIKSNPRLLKSFDIFKKIFMKYFKNYDGGLYDKGRFQNHIDKRIYLLYQGLVDKEKN